MRLLSLAVVSAFLATPALAQATYDVIPKGFGYDKKAGAVGMGTPWWSNRETRRVDVYTPAAIGITAGVFKELAFRNTLTIANAAKTSTVTMWMGYTKADPGQLPPKFSMLKPTRRVQIFKGTVNLPSTDRVTQKWVPVKLTTPFVYSRVFGNFMIEMQGKSASTTYWFMDATNHGHDWNRGVGTRYGTSCQGSQTSFAMSQILRTRHTCTPGGHINAYVFGINRPSKVVIQLLGFRRTSPFPIDLTAAGAPGCWLNTSPDIINVVPVLATIPSRYSIALWSMPLPNDPKISGAKINSQFIDIDKAANKLGMVFSNGLEVTVGSKGNFVYKGAGAWVYGIGTYGLNDWMDFYDIYEYVTIYRLAR